MLTRSLWRVALAFALVGLATLTSSAPAHAALSVTLQAVNPAAAGATASIGTNTVLPFNLISGQFQSIGSAVGESILGPSNMDMSTLTISTAGAGEVWVIFSMNGITSPAGAGAISQSITGQFVAGTPGTIEFTTFGDLDNTLYTTEPVSNPPTVVGTPVVTTLGGASSVLWTSDTEYSLTQVLKITFLTGGSVALSSDSFSTFNVPEPATLAVWSMFGLAGLGSFGWRRKRTAV